MAFSGRAEPSSQQAFQAEFGNTAGNEQRRLKQPQFDILEWYPQFQSCHRYFLDHAQHSGPVQALAAFVNIQLPYQKQPYPVMSSSSSSPHSAGPSSGLPVHLQAPNPFSSNSNMGHAQSVSLIPYIRRLVATGHDSPGVLHGFFGDDWVLGIGSLHEIERRNYLFAAKSTSWMKVKSAYDMSPEETVLFLSPLKDATEEEIVAAETTWSEWLAMQDWMLGPRTPDTMSQSPRVKREPQD
jgi:hypothetical protein